MEVVSYVVTSDPEHNDFRGFKNKLDGVSVLVFAEPIRFLVPLSIGSSFQ